VHRKELIPILRERPRTVHDLARELEVRPADLEDDLRHLARSLRGTPTPLIVEPAACRKCGFTFGLEKLGKPGRCPMCRETWIQPARVHIEG
jgi:predicted Zn-ribbon and HTH transcriptional regulator